MPRKERIAKKKEELIKTAAGSSRLLTNFFGKVSTDLQSSSDPTNQSSRYNLIYFLVCVLLLTSSTRFFYNKNAYEWSRLHVVI